MTFITTLSQIKDYEPCKLGFDLLQMNLRTRDLSKTVTLREILVSNGMKDAFWALRLFPYKEYCQIIIEIMESVIYAAEDLYEDITFIKDTIEAISLYNKDTITLDKLSTTINLDDVNTHREDPVLSHRALAVRAMVSATTRKSMGIGSLILFYSTEIVPEDKRRDQWKVNEAILLKFLKDTNQ